MSFSNVAGRFCSGFFLMTLLAYPLYALDPSPMTQLNDPLAGVISDLSKGNESIANADLNSISLPERKGLSPRLHYQYHLLSGYLNPPSSLNNSTIRKTLEQTGHEADLVFWRAYQGPLGKKYPEGSLSRRLSAMFPGSNYFHPRGGSGSHSAQALWKESLAELQHGHRNRAVELWKRIYAHHPLSSEAGLALHRLPSGVPMGDLLIPRWRMLSQMGQKKTVLRETLAYLKTNPSFPYRDRAILFAASGFLFEFKKAEALRLIEAGKAAKGVKLLSSLRVAECAAEDSSINQRQCIHAFLSRYPLSLVGRELAISSLRRSIAYGNSDLDPLWASPLPLQSISSGRESQWLFGFWFLSRGDRAKAREVWEGLEKTLSRSNDRGELLPRVSYFLARLDGLDQHLERAQRRYQDIIKHFPFSVYALWSDLSCGEDCGAFSLGFHHPSSFMPRLTLAHRQRLLRLIQLGMWGAAWTDYTAYRDPLMTKERFVRYGDLSLHLDPVRKLLLMDAVLGRVRPSILLSKTESLSPAVVSGFADSGVSIPWAISIARQESRFDPTVLSIDGAMGVMQLMPMTAMSTLRQVNLSAMKKVRQNMGVLREDYLNAWVGGLYLKKLLDHFPKNPERAVASYNAGMHSILGWSGISSMDWDFFIEGIPFKETRRYSREVLWNHEALRKSGKNLSVSRR